tara:strand:- start:27547 stop:28221 length:675 start_codon:yes stop_codon:yes gene_type:complete
MLLENSQDNWEIDLPENMKTLGLKISGGADSAIVCYMVAKYVTEERPDITIHPITAVASTKPFQQIFADKVLRKVESMTGIKFATHQYRTIDSSTVENYINQQADLVNDVYASQGLQKHFSGLTANPTAEDAPELYDGTHALPGSFGTNDMDRSKGLEKKDNTFRPLINVDKKGVAEHYIRLGVLEDIFPLTRSCEDDEVYTFEKHCEDCWFCRERQWGFGRLV